MLDIITVWGTNTPFNNQLPYGKGLKVILNKWDSRESLNHDEFEPKIQFLRFVMCHVYVTLMPSKKNFWIGYGQNLAFLKYHIAFRQKTSCNVFYEFDKQCPLAVATTQRDINTHAHAYWCSWPVYMHYIIVMVMYCMYVLTING